jgi:hypothetical protein
MNKTIVLVLVAAVCFGLLLACETEAKEETKYKVTYNLNLGSGENAVTGVSPTTIAAKTVVKGKTVTLPTGITSTSHNFNGWSTESGGTVLTGTTYKPTKNTILYAKWTKRDTPPDDTKWRITFNADNGSANTTLDVTKGKSATEDGATWPQNPTKASTSTTSYTFNEWREDGAATVTVYTAATKIEKAVTLKANYTETPIGGGDEPPPYVMIGDTKTFITELTASGGATVTNITEDGEWLGYEVVISNYGPYVSFKVDLGSGKTISDFDKVTLTYSTIQGDVGWKDLALAVSDTALPAYPNGLNGPLPNYIVSGLAWSKGIDEEKLDFVIGVNKGNNVVNGYADSKSNVIYFAFYLHAGGTGGGQNNIPVGDTTYSVSDIVFVPKAAGHRAASDILRVPTSALAGRVVDLGANAVVFPPQASVKTITWSLKDAGTTGVTAITGGKFTAATTGTIQVTGTITGGGAASADYSKDFSVSIVPPPNLTIKVGGVDQNVLLLPSQGGDALVTYDATSYTATTLNHGHSFVYFKVNLGDNDLAKLASVKVKGSTVTGGALSGTLYVAGSPEPFGTYMGFEPGNGEDNPGHSIGRDGLSGGVANIPIGTGEPWKDWQQNDVDPAALFAELVEEVAAKEGDAKKEVYFAISTHADGTTYKLSEIEFIFPAEFEPVTGITGVPTFVKTGTEVDLTKASVNAMATNKTIAWTLKTAGAGVTAITAGKITLSAEGEVVLTATVVNGATATTNFVRDITIKAVDEPGMWVKVGDTYQEITPVGVPATLGTLSADKMGYVTATDNYGAAFVYFKVDLGDYDIGDLAEVKVTYTVTGGTDTNWKNLYVAAAVEPATPGDSPFGDYLGLEGSSATLGRTAALSNASAVNAVASIGGEWSYDDYSTNPPTPRTNDIDANLAALDGETELYFVIGVHAPSSEYELSGIEFVFK